MKINKVNTKIEKKASVSRFKTKKINSNIKHIQRVKFSYRSMFSVYFSSFLYSSGFLKLLYFRTIQKYIKTEKKNKSYSTFRQK